MLRVRLIGAATGTVGVLVAALIGNGQEKLGLAGAGDSLRGALLRTPEVQRELKLKSGQIEKILRIVEQSKSSKKTIEEANGKGKGREKGKAKVDDPALKAQEQIVREAMERDFTDLERLTDNELNSILDASQRTRLTQIVLRVEGPSAFLTQELIDALVLGPEQLELIRDVLENVKAEQDEYKESQKQAHDLSKATGDPDLEKMRKNQEKSQSRHFSFRLNNQAMPRISQILTRRQLAIYKRMLGDSFDLSKLTGPEGRPLFDGSAGLAGTLLREPAVQLELKLTNAQKDQLANERAPEKVLNARQRNRLEQIAIQGEGLAAIARPEVIRALNLDEDQLVQIQERLGGLVGENRQLREALKGQEIDPIGGDPEQDAARKAQEKARRRSGTTDLNNRALRQLKSILTRRQREIYARLEGEPFDFSKLQAAPKRD